MGSVMDQERPWEREDYHEKERLRILKEREERLKNACPHNWEFQFAGMDYDHHKCTKCGQTRLT